MNFILFGVLVLCLIGIANTEPIWNNFAQTCQKDVDFECDPADPQKVTVMNVTLKCPGTQICNTILFDNCEPCIEISSNCYGKFNCTDDLSKVEVQNILFDCPKYHKCNNEFLDPCEPCVMVPCNTENQYTCSPNNDTTGTIGNISFECEPGFVCNIERLQPCAPCIAKKEGTETTTVPSTTTTTTGPTVVEDPDCNDGYGTTRACRPSNRTNDKNEKFYYRCNLVWWWYEAEMVNCAAQPTDVVCQNSPVICQ